MDDKQLAMALYGRDDEGAMMMARADRIYAPEWVGEQLGQQALARQVPIRLNRTKEGYMTQPNPNPALAGVARVSIASTMLGRHIYEAACLMKQEPASWKTLTQQQKIAFRRQALTILKDLR